MVSTLSCVAREDKHYSEICASARDFTKAVDPACRGVVSNFSSGEFGAYSGCSVKDISSWVLNRRALNNGTTSGTCASLQAKDQVPVPMESQSHECQAYLRQIGPEGTGIVTQSPLPMKESLKSTDSGLSGAIKAGIGIGTTMWVLLIIAIIVWIMLRRRKKQEAARLASIQDRTPAPAEASMIVPKIELPGDNPTTKTPGTEITELDTMLPDRYEMEGETPNEADPDSAIYEAPTGTEQKVPEIVELDGRSIGRRSIAHASFAGDENDVELSEEEHVSDMDEEVYGDHARQGAHEHNTQSGTKADVDDTKTKK
jgi:hypothetical protein